MFYSSQAGQTPAAGTAPAPANNPGTGLTTHQQRASEKRKILDYFSAKFPTAKVRAKKFYSQYKVILQFNEGKKRRCFSTVKGSDLKHCILAELNIYDKLTFTGRYSHIFN